MRLIRIYLLLPALLIVQFSLAQKKPSSLSNLRKKNIATKADIIRIDSLSLVPNTFHVTGISSLAYKIDEVNGELTWINKPKVDSVQVTYRVLSFRLNAVTQHYNFDSIRYNFLQEKPFKFNYNNQQDASIFNFGNVDYNGSIGRGISFGNNQDAVLTSSLNLQLSGFIGDSLELSAAITDNNIPIQPEGNTQNLQDFDKIFIQIKKRGWQANFGDIDIRQTKSYFLNFYKRMQGASFSTTNRIGKSSSNSLLLSGSVAKGKFARNVITPVEGNQGPYHLQGNNNEVYLTILAGTERVFMDGELLQRGENQDYVINYNTAEISFTPKRMVTKDSRIQVEFEYSDQNFLNSNFYINDEMNINNKLSLNLGVFSNQDAKNSSIDQVLSLQQKQFLANIGDRVDQAYYPNAAIDTFSAGKILYKKVDTLSRSNQYTSIYVYDVNNTDTLYSLSFTNVGFGKGNYVQLNDATNGKVFGWVSPDANNIPQGNYEPVVLLVTPKKQQIISLGADYKLDKKTTIKTEVALSRYDVNLFSTKDKRNDDGIAARIQLINEDKKLNLFNRKFSLQTLLGYEFVQNTFKPLERLRNVEFNRDWSLPLDAEAADEHLASAVFQMNDTANNQYHYEITSYNRNDHFNGFRQLFSSVSQIKKCRIIGQVSLTNTNSSLQKDFYLRPAIDISKQFSQLKNIQIGGGYSGEYNKLTDKIPDTLNGFSFAFNTWQAYIKSDDKKLNKWGITYFSRDDELPYRSLLQRANRSSNVTFNTELLKSSKNQLKFNVTYRKLHIINQQLSGSQREDESLLGRAEYIFNNWKGLLTGNVLYEVGSGQEQKLEYTYIAVPAGQGQYTWNDYNGDGIPQLNEFEIALFPDQATYVRVNTPSNQYVTANYIQFNYSFDINPQKIIKQNNLKGMKKLLSRFSTSSALQVNKKDISTGKFEFNPFTQKLVDTTLLSLSSFLSNTLYFNRTNSKWGMDITHSLNNNKSLLTYGFESRKLRTLNFKTRWNISRSFTTTIGLHSGVNQLNTPQFDNRNYDIREKGTQPSISYIYRSNFRFTLSYNYDDEKNKTGYHEHAVTNALTADMKYNVLSNSTISANFSLNNISFVTDPQGSANSTVGYVMLNGLLPGQNYLWNLQLTKRLAGNIEMTIEYDGRRPGTDRIIHTGRASIRAIL